MGGGWWRYFVPRYCLRQTVQETALWDLRVLDSRLPGAAASSPGAGVWDEVLCASCYGYRSVLRETIKAENQVFARALGPEGSSPHQCHVLLHVMKYCVSDPE